MGDRITEPQIGDFCLSQGSAWWIKRSMRWASGTQWIHSAVYVGDGQIVHSSIRYGGTKLDTLDALIEPHWSSLPRTITVLDHWDRKCIANHARSLVGRPFPSLWPQVIGFIRRHGGDPTAPFYEQPAWVRQMLHGTNTLYCLQVPYYAYRLAGIDLLPDGRPEGLVRPVDFQRFVPGLPPG